MTRKRNAVAVIGSGISGAAVAHSLAQAGMSVHLFDKARGPGGRLATRRAEWTDRQGRAVITRLDHGALGFTASSSAFQAFLAQALRAGCLAEWTPRLASDSLPLVGSPTLYVPVPDMPALCGHLLEGLSLSVSFAVDALRRGPQGWQVQAGGVNHTGTFDAVVLALPPAQAAPLLNPHRPDWARHASTAWMQPCWTLMGVATDTQAVEGAWGLTRPPSGPLAWVMRNDARPGRASVPGQAQWVAHARTGWSRRHLEEDTSAIQQQMQAALAEYLGQPVDWHHAVVHRWRYALPQTRGCVPQASAWWDAALGLGVCGDFLGGLGVEGAWLSAQALSAALLQPGSQALGEVCARTS